MTSPIDHDPGEYAVLALEVSGFYERLQFARQEDDAETAAVMEAEMNGSLEMLGDVIRALGRSAL